jgi:hypothetical protein
VNPWYNRLTSTSLIALLFLCLAWELWLAPLRPGGSMLALKALPLLVSAARHTAWQALHPPMDLDAGAGLRH